MPSKAATPSRSAPSASRCSASLRGALRDAASISREKAENIEQGFGHETEKSTELAEQADEIESAADELDDWAPDNEWDADEVWGTIFEDGKPEDEDDITLEQQNAFDEAAVAFVAEVIDSARSAVESAEGNCP